MVPFQVREETPSYSGSILQGFESFENPLAGQRDQSFGSHDHEETAAENPQFGKALYDFSAGGDDEVIIFPLNDRNVVFARKHSI